MSHHANRHPAIERSADVFSSASVVRMPAFDFYAVRTRAAIVFIVAAIVAIFGSPSVAEGVEEKCDDVLLKQWVHNLANEITDQEGTEDSVAKKTRAFLRKTKGAITPQCLSSLLNSDSDLKRAFNTHFTADDLMDVYKHEYETLYVRVVYCPIAAKHCDKDSVCSLVIKYDNVPSALNCRWDGTPHVRIYPKSEELIRVIITDSDTTNTVIIGPTRSHVSSLDIGRYPEMHCVILGSRVHDTHTRAVITLEDKSGSVDDPLKVSRQKGRWGRVEDIRKAILSWRNRQPDRQLYFAEHVFESLEEIEDCDTDATRFDNVFDFLAGSGMGVLIEELKQQHRKGDVDIVAIMLVTDGVLSKCANDATCPVEKKDIDNVIANLQSLIDIWVRMNGLPVELVVLNTNSPNAIDRSMVQMWSDVQDMIGGCILTEFEGHDLGTLREEFNEEYLRKTGGQWLTVQYLESAECRPDVVGGDTLLVGLDIIGDSVILNSKGSDDVFLRMSDAVFERYHNDKYEDGLPEEFLRCPVLKIVRSSNADGMTLRFDKRVADATTKPPEPGIIKFIWKDEEIPLPREVSGKAPDFHEYDKGSGNVGWGLRTGWMGVARDSRYGPQELHWNLDLTGDRHVADWVLGGTIPEFGSAWEEVRVASSVALRDDKKCNSWRIKTSRQWGLQAGSRWGMVSLAALGIGLCLGGVLRIVEGGVSSMSKTATLIERRGIPVFASLLIVMWLELFPHGKWPSIYVCLFPVAMSGCWVALLLMNRKWHRHWLILSGLAVLISGGLGCAMALCALRFPKELEYLSGEIPLSYMTLVCVLALTATTIWLGAGSLLIPEDEPPRDGRNLPARRSAPTFNVGEVDSGPQHVPPQVERKRDAHDSKTHT